MNFFLYFFKSDFFCVKLARSKLFVEMFEVQRFPFSKLVLKIKVLNLERKEVIREDKKMQI